MNGGETNYISATLAIYLDLYNVFTNLLALLGIFGCNPNLLSARTIKHRPAGRFFYVRRPAQSRSNSAIDSTCDVFGNMFTTPAPFSR